MIALALSYLTKDVLFGALGSVWRGFCNFISTPIGAALVAGLVAYNVGTIHEYHKVNAAWQAKWSAAEAQAEAARKKRDADIAAQVTKDSDARLDALAKRKAELEAMLKKYEEQDAHPPKAGTAVSPYTDGTDDRWLRDIQRHSLAKGRR